MMLPYQLGCHITTSIESLESCDIEGSTFPLESSRATQEPPANLAGAVLCEDELLTRLPDVPRLSCLSLSILFFLFFLNVNIGKNLSETWNRLSIQFIACSSFARRLGALPLPSKVHT